MTKQYSFGRRQFLTATGAAGIAGFAGCTALESTDDEPTASEDERPDAVVEQYYQSLAEIQQTQTERFHSEVREEFDLRQIETTVVEEDLDRDEFTARVDVDDDAVERIVDDENTAIVEAEFEVVDGGDEHEEKETWALATEDGEWKLVDDRAEDPETRVPNLVFSFDYEEDEQTVTITIDSGDSDAVAQHFHVRGQGLASEYEGPFHEIPDSDFEADEGLYAGYSLDVEVEDSDFEITIIYETEEKSATLEVFEGPDA